RPNLGSTKSVGATTVGAWPPAVTVMASIDCLPLAAVMTTWPHSAVGAPRCCSVHGGRPAGTVTVIEASLQEVTGALTPPMVTFAPLLHTPLLGVQDPNPS